MKKISKIIKHLPIMIPACIVYLSSAYMLPNTDGTLKTFLYISFLVSFVAFGGSIINLLDLKYIGKGFIE